MNKDLLRIKHGELRHRPPRVCLCEDPPRELLSHIIQEYERLLYMNVIDQCTIRTFRPSDEQAIIQLWQACELIRPWNSPSLDIARKLSVNPEWFLVGELNGELIACAMFGYEGHRGWVNYLAVAPAHQRKGYASQLMTHGEQLLKSAGCSKLNLQVRSTNSRTLAFYESLGYTNDEVISLGKRLLSD